MKIDLFIPKVTEMFNNSTIYRKSVLVDATQVSTPQVLETVLENGLVETTRTVDVGEWIVTNPNGEQYAIIDEKFKARYVKELNRYRAKGRAFVIPNFTDGDVEITAPWGEPQYGDKDCYFASATDEKGNISNDRYIIGGKEFLETYEEDK